MSAIRTVIAGEQSNMLAEIVEQIFELRPDVTVVARANGKSDVAELSHEFHADLVLLCDTAPTVGGRYEKLRDSLGDTALIVIGHDGRSACTCIDDPGIEELSRLIGLACRTRLRGKQTP